MMKSLQRQEDDRNQRKLLQNARDFVRFRFTHDWSIWSYLATNIITIVGIRIVCCKYRHISSR